MSVGQKIDLSGCSYGETNGPCPFIYRPTNYYFFLAGLVSTHKFTYILEIGTHFGGAIMSMSRGIPKKDVQSSRLVTVDIANKNREGFRNYPFITRILGDSLDKRIIKKVLGCFDRPADIVYIDSVHEYLHTKRNIEIYATALNPLYLVLDDIRQCDSMKRLWKELTKKFKNRAFDASEISIRKGAGFGVIQWRET